MVGCNSYLASSKKAVSNSKPRIVKSTFVKMNKSENKWGTKSMKVK